MNDLWLRSLILTGTFVACGCTPNDDNGSGRAGATSHSGGSPSGQGGSNVGGSGSAGKPAGSGGTMTQGSGGTGGAMSSGGSGATGGTSAGSPGTAGNGRGGAGSPGASGGSAGTATGGVQGGTSQGGSPAGGAAPLGGAGGTSGAGATGGAVGDGAVTIALDSPHQVIQGFGINDTWQPSAFSSAVADALFTTTGKGIGLTILRTGMTDGWTDSSSPGFYNSFEKDNITAIKNRAGTDAKIIGSVWSPPANCKTNNNVKDGGHLCAASNASTPNNKCSSNANSTCYDTFGTAIANFAKNNGLYAMSIANEPDFASCGSADPCNGNYPTTLYTANEMVAFVKSAGPKLQQAGVKVIAPEASEWNHTWSNTSAGPDLAGKNSSDPLACGFPASSKCDDGSGYDYGHFLAKDATAWAAFDILGVHEYDSQQADAWPADVTVKPKEVWQTEMSGVKWWPEQGSGTGDNVKGTSDIANGIAVATWIHSALVVGDASAWLWWWYQPLMGGTNDNEGLLLLDGTDTRRHYTLGNYSKFVRPGYTRVDVKGNVPTSMLLSAYKGGDGTVVLVAINKNTSSVSLPITIAGGMAPAMMTPTVTSATSDLVAGTAVPVTGGVFTAELGASTVTTFVGK